MMKRNDGLKVGLEKMLLGGNERKVRDRKSKMGERKKPMERRK